MAKWVRQPSREAWERKNEEVQGNGGKQRETEIFFGWLNVPIWLMPPWHIGKGRKDTRKGIISLLSLAADEGQKSAENFAKCHPHPPSSSCHTYIHPSIFHTVCWC
jgi:hypothetical protein